MNIHFVGKGASVKEKWKYEKVIENHVKNKQNQILNK
jgi:hypothetical protein